MFRQRKINRNLIAGRHTIVVMVILLLIAMQFQVAAQKFWLITNQFPGGLKTGITIAGDSCVFVSTVNGIIRSCNDGNTFDHVFTAPVIYKVFSSESGKVFSGGAGKIYFSGDMGNSWDSISLLSNYPVTQFIEKNSGEYFAITGTLDLEEGDVGEGVFFSDDNGVNWVQHNNGLRNYRHCNRIAADSYGRLYLAMADEYVTGHAGLFISENNGTDWEHIDIIIDGKGAIPDALQVGSTFGLSVSPDDSVYLSFTGVADNVGVDINLVKSIHKIKDSSRWRVLKVWQSVSWWDERILNNIHFAHNGDWYSSANGTLHSGATYLSKDKGKNWEWIDYGLGVDIYQRRNTQFFAEKFNGSMFMVQLLDERIYKTDTSMLATGIGRREPNDKCWLFPNPVKATGKVTIYMEGNTEKHFLTIANVKGEVLYEKKIFQNNNRFEAPNQPGIYFVMNRSGRSYFVSKLVVL